MKKSKSMEEVRGVVVEWDSDGKRAGLDGGRSMEDLLEGRGGPCPVVQLRNRTMEEASFAQKQVCGIISRMLRIHPTLSGDYCLKYF